MYVALLEKVKALPSAQNSSVPTGLVASGIYSTGFTLSWTASTDNVAVTAYEYMRKNGGDSSRVTAIEQLAQQKTGPIKLELIDALTDKDLAVRAAAAKALGNYHDPSVSPDLFKLFIDPKPPVRLTAAAAYINSTQPPTVTRKKTTKP